jgi:hypothetical protein
VGAGGFAQQGLELDKDLLDRVRVGRIFQQEEQFDAGRAELTHGGTTGVEVQPS